MKKALETILDPSVVTGIFLTTLSSTFTAGAGYATYELFHQGHPLIGAGGVAYTSLMAYFTIAMVKSVIDEIKK